MIYFRQIKKTKPLTFSCHPGLANLLRTISGERPNYKVYFFKLTCSLQDIKPPYIPSVVNDAKNIEKIYLNDCL